MSFVFWWFYGFFYDTIWDSEIPKRIADAVELHLPADAEVLDFGCGTGLISRELLARGHRVMAVDSSAAMLQRARSVRRASEFALGASPPPGRRFPSTITVNVLHLVDSPASVLGNLLAVTDGPVIAVWPRDAVSLRDLAGWERKGGKSFAWTLRSAACRILVGMPGLVLRVRTVAEMKLHRLVTEASEAASRSLEFRSIPDTGCVMAIFTSSTTAHHARVTRGEAE